MTERMQKETKETVVESGRVSPVPEREGVLAYFRNSWGEFKKVVWPTRDDTVKMTLFVVVFVAILALFIYAVDSFISWLFFDILLKRG